MIARLQRVNFLARTHTNISKLRQSRWKTIEIMKIVQSSNVTSKLKLKGYLFQTKKLWEDLIVLTKT